MNYDPLRFGIVCSLALVCGAMSPDTLTAILIGAAIGAADLLTGFSQRKENE